MGARTRILHVVGNVGRAGTQQIVLGIVSHSDRFDHRVAYLAGPHSLRDALAEHGASPAWLGYRRGHILRTVRRLISTIRSERIDLVHDHTWNGRCGALAAWWCRVPVVFHMQNVHPNFGRSRSVGRSLRSLVSRLTKWAQAAALSSEFVFCSELVRASHQPYINAASDRLHVIHNAVPVGNIELRSDISRRQRTDASSVLLSVARLHSEKNVLALVPMMKVVRRRRPEARLLIAGGGPLEGVLRAEITRSGLSGAIELLGERDDVPTLLGEADVLVCPSLREGLPVCLLEAMAAALPIAAFRVEPIDRIVEDGRTGLLAEPPDPEGLADATVGILGRPDRGRSLGLAGREIAARRFDIASTTAAVEDVYDSLLRPVSSRPPQWQRVRAASLVRHAVPEAPVRTLQAAARRHVYSRSVDITADTAVRSCVVLAPHADDETLGCGATIMRKTDAGTAVHIVVATEGSREDGRDAEAKRAAGRLGVPSGDIELLGFPEYQLHACSSDLIAAVRRVVAATNPDELLVCSEHDPHVDHKALSAAVRSLVATGVIACPVLEYPIWFWKRFPWRSRHGRLMPYMYSALVEPLGTLRSMRPFIVSTDGYLERKRLALGEHRSQIERRNDRPPVLDARFVDLFFGPYEVFFSPYERPLGSGVAG